MAELYPWFVVVHLVGLVLFAISHGASAFMAFRLRAERDPVVVEALLKTGQLSVGPMYIGLLLLIVGGLGAAAGAEPVGQDLGHRLDRRVHRAARRDVGGRVAVLHGPSQDVRGARRRTAALRSNLRRWRDSSTPGDRTSSRSSEPWDWCCSSG